MSGHHLGDRGTGTPRWHLAGLPDVRIKTLGSLRQLEGVELFCRGSEVAELVGGHSHHRKRERWKRRSEQGVQIVPCSDADGDVGL